MKKRTLLAATAMLLVAILAATGSTYAWFMSSGKAEATISMTVADASSLKVSGDNSTWATSVGNQQLGIDATKIWDDYSIGSDAFKAANPVFWSDVYAEADKALSYSSDAKTIVSATVYFRSTSSEPVTVKAASIDYTTAPTDKLVAGLRVGIKKDGATSTNGAVYGKAAGENTAVSAENATANTVSFSAIADAVQTEVATMSESGVTGDNYYYGKATFYFWVDGVVTNEADLRGYSDAIASTFSFTQAGMPTE